MWTLAPCYIISIGMISLILGIFYKIYKLKLSSNCLLSLEFDAMLSSLLFFLFLNSLILVIKIYQVWKCFKI